MEKQITMPKFGPQMQNGVIVAWCKSPGEVVKAGETLFEVETDKVVSEVESPFTGKITKYLCEQGDTVAVGEPVVAYISE